MNSKLVILWATLSVASASAADKTPPGSAVPFTSVLEHFDLEIPVQSSTKAGVEAVKTLVSDPAKGFESKPGYGAFCWVENGTQLVFQVPPNGATTPGSHFPRTELIQKKTERWKVSSGDHALFGTFAVSSVPKVTDKGEITLAQIHTDASDHGPLLKLICDYESKPWKLMAEHRLAPEKSSKIIRTEPRKRASIEIGKGMQFEVTLSKNRALKVRVRKFGAETWDDLTDSSERGANLDAAWDEETCYFKAGCYMFDPSDNAAPVGEIRFAQLSLQ